MVCAFFNPTVFFSQKYLQLISGVVILIIIAKFWICRDEGVLRERKENKKHCKIQNNKPKRKLHLIYKHDHRNLMVKNFKPRLDN